MTAEEGPGRRLVAWAEEHGGWASPKVAFLRKGVYLDRCCTAIQKLEDDELLVEIPRHLAFESPPCAPVGVRPELLALLQQLVSEGQHGSVAGHRLAVVLLVHHERMRGDASDFAPYLDTLPTGYPTMPLLDKEPPWQVQESPEGAMYEGTGVPLMAEFGGAVASAEGVALMRSTIERLDPTGLHWHLAQRGNDDNLRWAAASVQSRAHASKRGATALLPLADAFNHSPSSANVELVEADSGSFQVRAMRAIELGEELLLCYGHCSNAELLFNAGFACMPNPHDAVLVRRGEILDAVRQRWERKGLPLGNLEERSARLTSLGLPGAGATKLRASAPLLGQAAATGLASLLAGLLLSPAAWHMHFGAAEGGGGSLCAECGGDSGAGHLHDLWALDGEVASTGQASSAEVGEALRAEILLTLLELVLKVLQDRFPAPDHEDRTLLKAAEKELKVTYLASAVTASPPAARKAQLPSSVVALLRKVNILRVRVGERSVLAQLETALRARLGLGKVEVEGSKRPSSAIVIEDSPPHRKRTRAPIVTPS